MVVEIGPRLARVTKIRVDFHERIMRIGKPRVIGGRGNLADVFSHADTGASQIVVSMDSDVASTVIAPVTIVRENSEMILGEAELGNIVSEAMQKLFEKERLVMAKKMNVSSADVAIVDARIFEIYLDNRKVLDPLGFSGGTATLLVSLTCVPRAWAAAIHGIFPTNRVALITEGATSFARVVARSAPKMSAIFAYISPERTALINCDKSYIGYQDSFEWGGKLLFTELIRQLGVGEDIGARVLLSERQGLGSPDFRAKIGELLAREYHILQNGLRQAVAESAAQNIYIAAAHALPEFISTARIKNKSGRLLKISTVSENFISESFGFEVKWKSGGDKVLLQHIPIHVLDAYLTPQYELVKTFVRRRIRWLAGQNDN